MEDYSHLNFDGLGAKLRQARMQRQMTLAELAGRAGCSVSLVSKIERSKASPSLRTLHRIAAGLETTIGELFSQNSTSDVVIYTTGQRPTLNIPSNNGAGSIRLERLAPHFDGKSLDGNIHVVSPGASNGGAITHTGEELGYVLQGKLELTVAHQTYLLTAGDSFFFRSELPHSYRNVGAEEVRVLWVATPPTF